MIDANSIWKDVKEVRSRNPLVINITNYVVTNTTANALLALGASPAMTHAIREIEDMVAIADALVINMGTLTDAYIESMLAGGLEANKRDVPVVLDPVAVGASRLRNETAEHLLREVRPTIIRANASEVMALAGEGAGKGVDSLHGANDALEAAMSLAKTHSCAVAISGEEDLVTDGETTLAIANGHAMMPKVTGLGCTASAVCGAFAAVSETPLEAAAAGMAVMGLAGEMAAEKAKGPGTLQLYLYDALYLLKKGDVSKRLKLKTL